MWCPGPQHQILQIETKVTVLSSVLISENLDNRQVKDTTKERTTGVRPLPLQIGVVTQNNLAATVHLRSRCSSLVFFMLSVSVRFHDNLVENIGFASPAVVHLLVGAFSSVCVNCMVLYGF